MRVGVGRKWGALEHDNVRRRMVPGEDAGRVLWIHKLRNSVEDILEVRKEVNREVDAVGRDWSEVRVDIHVVGFLICFCWLQGKQLEEVQRLADHIVNGKCVIIDSIKIQLNKRGPGNHGEAGCKVGQEQICRWEVANMEAVVG